MRVILPGCAVVDWSLDEVAQAMRALADALEASKPQTPPSRGLPGEVEMLDGDRFRFRGRVYPLSRDQWIVLDEMVTGDGEFSEIADRLWGDPTRAKKKLYRPVRALREKLRKLGLPFTAESKNERAVLQATE